LLCPIHSQTFPINVTAYEPQVYSFTVNNFLSYALLSTSLRSTLVFNPSSETADIAITVVIGNNTSTIMPRALTDLIPPNFEAPPQLQLDRLDPCGRSILISPPGTQIPAKLMISSNVTITTGMVEFTYAVSATQVQIPGTQSILTGDVLAQYITAVLPNLDPNIGMIEMKLIMTSGFGFLGDLFPQVIAASGEECPVSGPSNTPDRIVADMPEQKNYTIKMPPRNVWYIEFVKTTEAAGTVLVEFTTIPPQPAPGPDNNETGVIVGVIITILLVIGAGVIGYVVYRRQSGGYQVVG